MQKAWEAGEGVDREWRIEEGERGDEEGDRGAEEGNS